MTLCFGQVISVFLKCAKVLGFSKNNTKVVFTSYDCYNDYSPARVVLYMVQLSVNRSRLLNCRSFVGVQGLCRIKKLHSLCSRAAALLWWTALPSGSGQLSSEVSS